MAKELNLLKLGYAAAIWAALFMLVLGVLGNLGLYAGAVQMMQQWHMFFDLSALGIITGMIEAAIISFILIYSFGWIYLKLEKMK